MGLCQFRTRFPEPQIASANKWGQVTFKPALIEVGLQNGAGRYSDRFAIRASFLADGLVHCVNKVDPMHTPLTRRTMLSLRFVGVLALAPFAQSQVSSLTVPTVELSYLKAQYPDSVDRFGYSIAIDGDTLVVGAAFEDSAATGIDGNANDNTRPESGAAFVFERSGNNWIQAAYLKQNSAAPGQFFGSSVAVSGNWIAVGFPGDSATLPGSGSVYLYRRQSGSWSLYQILIPDSPSSFDSFGYALAIHGELLVVGAPGESSNATGVNGNALDNSAHYAGAAFAFRFDGSQWNQEAYLKASNTDAEDRLGTVVAVFDHRIAVSSTIEASSAGGVDGDASLNDMNRAGAVYLFEIAGSSWSQVAYCKASFPGHQDDFGTALALGTDRLLVGAQGEDGPIGGDGSTDSMTDSGAVYEYSPGLTGWEFVRYIKPDSVSSSDRFGWSLALKGTTLLASSPGNDCRGNEIGADISASGNGDSGGAYLLNLAVDPPALQAFLKASNADPVDTFGHAVGLGAEYLCVSAQYERSLAGSGAIDPSNNDGSLVGAAYVFQRDVPLATFCGPGQPNSTGFPGRIASAGSTVIAQADFRLLAFDLPPNQFGYFLNSRANGWVANPGGSEGVLCLGSGGAAIGRHVADLTSSGPAGQFDVAIQLGSLPTPTVLTAVLAGETWFFQGWYRDLNPGNTSNLTNGLMVRFE